MSADNSNHPTAEVTERVNSPTEMEETETKRGSNSADTTKTSPKHRAANRRSILNIHRRQSRSIAAGIPYEDQVAAMDQSLPTAERLATLVRLAGSAAAASVGQQIQQESSETETFAEFVEEVCSDLRRKEFSLVASSAERALALVQQMGPSSDREGKMMSSRKAGIHGYIAELNGETEAWRQLLAERKEAYNAAKAEKKAAIKKELVVREGDVASAGLEIESARSMAERMCRKRRQLRDARASVCAGVQRQLGELSHCDNQLEVAARKVIAFTSKLDDGAGSASREGIMPPAELAKEAAVLLDT